MNFIIVTIFKWFYIQSHFSKRGKTVNSELVLYRTHFVYQILICRNLMIFYIRR